MIKAERVPVASIRDVADRAGVGVATVSRVINETGYASEATRKRVMDAIDELGFVPNQIARNFQSQRSGMVALIVPSIEHPFFAELAFSAERTLDQLGFRMMLGNSLFETEKELGFINLLERNVIDGMIIVSNSDIGGALKEGMAVVSIDRHLSHEHAFISSDNEGGGRLAARRLLEADVRRPAFVGGFPDVDTEVLKRRTGFVAELMSHGLVPEIIDYGGVIEDEDRFAEDVARRSDDFDGVFAITDMLALRLISAFQRAGRSVPGDIQVVGYDGIDLGPYEQRPLTSVAQPIAAIGETAAMTIAAILAGAEVDERVVLPVSMLEGSSTRRGDG